MCLCFGDGMGVAKTVVGQGISRMGASHRSRQMCVAQMRVVRMGLDLFLCLRATAGNHGFREVEYRQGR